MLNDFTPLVERISIDEAFADVAGCTHLFVSPAEIASAIWRRVRKELGLPISVGVARTKHLAKIASQVAKPDGLVIVDPTTELDFLHNLPVELMWGVGPVTKARLAESIHPGQSIERASHSLPADGIDRHVPARGVGRLHAMVNLSSFIRFHAARSPERIAVVFMDQRITYAELSRRIERTAGYLAAQGIGPDDVVAVMMKNSAAFLELAFAASHLGAVFLPINFRLAADEVEYIAANAGAKLVLADAEFAAAVANLPATVLLDDAAQADTTALSGRYPPAPMQVCKPNDLFRLMYTSGTTDRPKGVIHTYDNFYWKSIDHVIALGLGEDDRLLVAGPLYHVGVFDLPGVAVLWVGGMLCIHRDFEVERVLASVAVEKLTGGWLASSGAFAVHEVARDLGMLCLHTNSETSALTADPKLRLPNVFRTCRQGIHDFDRRRRLRRQHRQGQEFVDVDDRLPRLCLRPRHHRGVHDLREALQAGRGSGRRVLAETVPAGLHRDFHQDPADEAAGALHLPVGRRHHRLHRSGQHLRDVRADRDVRGEHGRLHRAHGGQEPAERHPFRQPLHQDFPIRRRMPLGPTPIARSTTNTPPTGPGRTRPRCSSSPRRRSRRTRRTAPSSPRR